MKTSRIVVYRGEFEWDAAKAVENIKKHGVSFIEGASAFADEYAVVLPSASTSHEERFDLVGFSGTARLLIVVHCERERPSGVRTRIISARLADRKTARAYAKQKGR
jgi:uncharacterized DUF497 family protein